MPIKKNNKDYGTRVKVEEITPSLTTLNATANGTYTPTSPYNGYSSVTVNVSGGGDNEYDTWIFENISGETADLTFNGFYKNCSYSLDEGVTWIDLPSDSDGWSTNNNYTINFGNIVYVKYNDVVRDYSVYMFTCNKRYNLSGDLYKSYKPYIYSHAFDFNANLIDASGLIFHTDTVGFHSLDRMFYNCTALTTAPALPATKLWNNCYREMFYNCTALTTAPALPATTLTESCYYSMFENCTALTTAPALPATTLAASCYREMFRGCTSLTTATALPATTLTESCYYSMFYNCTALTTAPALPATTLAASCYREMFRGCRNLNSVTTYTQDISASNCLTNWLNSVSATGQFYNIGGASFTSGASGIPEGWTEYNSL